MAAPTKPSAMAVLRMSAIVIVALRRMPSQTPDRTKFARITSFSIGGRGGTCERSAADSVHAAVLVADDLAHVELDDAPAHRVDDVVVVRGHDDRRTGA